MHMMAKYKFDPCHHYLLCVPQNNKLPPRCAMKRLCRGDKSFLPKELLSPAVICVSSDMTDFILSTYNDYNRGLQCNTLAFR